MNYPDDFIDRITALAARGASVAIELDALALKGIHVITLFDSDYPVLLKRKLKRKTHYLFRWCQRCRYYFRGYRN